MGGTAPPSPGSPSTRAELDAAEPERRPSARRSWLIGLGMGAFGALYTGFPVGVVGLPFAFTGPGRAPSSVVIRPADAADAEGLARVRIATWRAAYRGIVPDTVLDGFDPTADVVTWRKRLTGVTDARTEVASALEAPARPRLVGFITTGPARHAGEAGLGEVWAIYVDPEAQGQGVGRALMDAAVRDLTKRGFRGVVLWVFDANAPACTSYERLGWTPDGATKTFEMGGATPVELRYRRRLP